jgi:radical SAM protein with 4Fe4S-binding SPASM domain
MSKNLSPTICLLPVSSVSIHATGKIVRCQMSETPMGDISEGSIIEQWDNTKFQELRKHQLEGKWLKGCDNCKIKEEKGVVSKRQHWMSLDLFDDVWNKVEWSNLKGNNIYHLDIAFNNLCNFKCKMCSSAYSNAWIGDERKLKELGFTGGSSGTDIRTSSTWSREKWSLKSSQLTELLDRAPDLRRVEILGGEPFLVPEFAEFLKILKYKGLHKKVEIMVTTNGSVITEEKLDWLEGFKYVNLNLSLDGTGEYFSYMRSAGVIDWENIVKKAELIKNWCAKERSNRYKLNINGTFQLINIVNIKDFIEFIVKFYGWDKDEPENPSKFRNSFEHRILIGPKIFKSDWATNSLIEESLSQIDYLLTTYPFLNRITEKRYLNDIKKMLLNLKENTPTEAIEYRKKFVSFINALDSIRSENIDLVAPEVYKELFR